MNLENITAQVCELTKKAASFVDEALLKFNANDIVYKGTNDLVSFVDQETEKFLIKELELILPEAGFLAEEGTSINDKNKEYYWVIDPIDGTTNYIHKVPVFAISIALMRQKVVLIGVVHELNRNECFSAWQNGGAYLNNVPIKVSSINSLSKSIVATGFPYYNFEKLDNYIEILKTLMKKSHGIRRFGAASVDLAYVACGRFEAFFEYNLKPWDVAAGTLIVKEAGGIVKDFKGGNDFVFGCELIAGCAMFNELETIIQENW
jgi:myo-inositol-1(or 4)-monophosphatase